MFTSTILLTAHVVAAQVTAAPQLSPCELQTHGMATRTRAQCGSLDVKDAGGETVTIGFAVLSARAQNKKPDPVVFLAGGPGQASTQVAGLVGRALDSVQQDRDLILFDARGTGRSMAFGCTDSRALNDKLRTPHLSDEAARQQCLKGAKLNPRSLTTERIAADLEALRVALGVEQLNLVGASYGTRLAMVYDRAYPGRVRALVLDGLAPPGMVIGDRFNLDAEAALRALSKRCDEDSLCKAGGPSLDTIVQALIGAAEQPVVLAHPTTALPATVNVNKDLVAGVVVQSLYTDETAALLVPALRSAHAGDLKPLAALALLGEQQEQGIDAAMYLSVVCAEDVPFMGALVPGLLPDHRSELLALCKQWPHAEVGAEFRRPSSSATPALLLSGTNDPVTPPARGEEALQTLKNGRHLVANGLGHGVFFRSCMPDVIADFIDAPDPKAVDGSCAARLSPFPPFVDLMGPSP